MAAYFAFHERSQAANASIFAYCEYSEGHKSGSSNEPEIRGLGRYVRGHRRHLNQQSEYKVCTVFRNGKLRYASHDDVFAAASVDQDILCKFDVPMSERKKVLRRLKQYNINAFSLVGSEESLMESLANSRDPSARSKGLTYSYATARCRPGRLGHLPAGARGASGRSAGPGVGSGPRIRSRR